MISFGIAHCPSGAGSIEGQAAIGDYRIDGQQLFHPSAEASR